jgi:hypothetical protein
MATNNSSASTVPPGARDSGYASQVSARSNDGPNSSFTNRGSAVQSNRPWNSIAPKPRSLFSFVKDIPDLSQKRFEDLRTQHSEALLLLTRSLGLCDILMNLKVLGEKEESAAPWVFVQCHKKAEPKIRKFFKQPAIKSDFQPSQPSQSSPHFDIYICPFPTMRNCRTNISSNLPPGGGENRNTIDPAEVYIYGHGPNQESLCGREIEVWRHGDNCAATVGGLIKVGSHGGDSVLYAMTAGHFLSRGEYEEIEEEEAELSDDFGDTFSEDGDVFELDLGVPDEVFQIEDAVQASSSFAPLKLGHVYKTSHDNVGDGPNLDWALITIDNKSLYLPNIIKGHPIASPQPAMSTGLQRKVIIGTSIDQIHNGTLSLSWSYLMLAPSQTLSRMYLLTLATGAGMAIFSRCHSKR